MRVPGIVYADESLIEAIRGDGTLEQLANAACLPGIVGAALAMPDAHCGYGLPIGGVVATRAEDGVVTPGGVGFDINCGVRLARTRLHRDEITGSGSMRGLVAALLSRVPAGVGARRGGAPAARRRGAGLTQGARWAVSRGFGTRADLAHTESGGCLPDADPDALSPKARERGRDQQGTLGSGNHFVELQYVERIFDAAAARAFGVERDQVTLMIHSGSRGLGHQVCTDHLAIAAAAMRKYGIAMPDGHLACVPVRSPEGGRYLAAMRCAANYAWANRQCLMALAGEALAAQLRLSPAAARPLARLRRGPQHREIRAPPGGGAGAGAGRPPQGRDARLSRGSPRTPGRLPRGRPAGHRPREHGDRPGSWSVSSRRWR